MTNHTVYINVHAMTLQNKSHSKIKLYVITSLTDLISINFKKNVDIISSLFFSVFSWIKLSKFITEGYTILTPIQGENFLWIYHWKKGGGHLRIGQSMKHSVQALSWKQNTAKRDLLIRRVNMVFEEHCFSLFLSLLIYIQ